VVALAALGAAVVVVVLGATASGASEPSRSDTSPVDLATPVDMADAVAHQSAVVRAGDARIEVLGPTLLRLEYSPTATFEDNPTVNALHRRMPVPTYRASVTGGWLTVRTRRATLRYKVGSGPFTATNTVLQLRDATQVETVHPTWEWECPFDQTCQAGAATLRRGATLSFSQSGYESESGYVGDLARGANATWTVLSAPAGPAQLSLRYSNVAGPGATAASHGVDLLVNGRVRTTLAAPPTDPAQPWSTVTTTVSLRAGTNSVQVRCTAATRCPDLDTVGVGPLGVDVSDGGPAEPLGGWIRGFDTFTYQPIQPCAAGTAGATCDNTFEPQHTDGLLDRAGWRLLDDTKSAVWTTGGWTETRPRSGDVEDGYLFAYGQDYAGALHTLAQLTGPAPLLPRTLFGVWYSDYTPYSSATIENSLYPAFQKNDVPLDTLSLDTDWKAPNNWDGWEWNAALFPHPDAFLRWARSKHVAVTLNVHSSIAVDDPKVPTAQRVAGTTLPKSSCQAGICKIWNWSSVAQAESNFTLQQSFLDQGVAFWWLDWCCDASVVSDPGVTPDAWIGHLYAQEMVNEGRRGFVLARVGSSNGNPQRVYPAGPWSDHTSAIAFTGDAWGTWNTLAQEVALTPDEATIGEPYVSDDIGSFLGPPPGQALDPSDLYDRWVQLGTFQPILRLHSNNGDRLPWQYPQPVRAITEAFLRLRDALIPYTYTLAAQAHVDGMPMARPLYLDYPQVAAAYAHPEEYLFGPDVLVAPVTSPGAVAPTTVWLPPGRWVDYFTGATFTGPITTTLSVPLSRMPVFVRAGGIIPEQPSTATSATHGVTPLVLDVFPGSSGSFTLYSDSGTGLGYTKGQFTTTTISDSTSAGTGTGAGSSPTLGVIVGRARGHYRGQPVARAYRVEVENLSEPSEVTVNGRRLDAVPSGAAGPGWSYQGATSTVVIDTPSSPVTRALSVVATGGRVLDRAEPPAPTS
jgi:hypothetical protein